MEDSTIKKKVLFVFPSLVSGGGEIVLLTLFNFLDRDKYEMHLILFEEKGVYLSDIPEFVQVYDLKKKSRFDFFKLVTKQAAMFKKVKPDIVMSFFSYTNLVTVLAGFFAGKKTRIIINEHSPLSPDLTHGRMLWLKKILYRIFYKYADICVVPSQGVKSDLVQSFGMDNKNIVVIYNPLDLDMINQLKEEAIDSAAPEKFIIAAGRLTESKGFRYLLEAYALIYKDIEEKLVIAGEGELEQELKKHAEDLGIEKNVVFAGFQKNPFKYMRRASALVLSSLWESFGLVIVEAMECGTPVIAADCFCGPSEIITNSVDGILVPVADVPQLANAMRLVLKDKELSLRLVRQGKARAKAFGIKNILPQYEALLQE